MKGMDKKPYYGLYVWLQWVLFLYLSILFALWPWLAGTETSLDVFGIAFPRRGTDHAGPDLRLLEGTQPRRRGGARGGHLPNRGCL